jgi:hypothetical protein
MRDKVEQHTVIPALPGWYVALYIEGGEVNGKRWDDYLSLDPIVAWEIERHDHSKGPDWDRCVSHYFNPLTVDGNMDGAGNLWAIKTPDGKFTIPMDQTVGSEDELIAVFREKLLRMAAKKSA